MEEPEDGVWWAGGVILIGTDKDMQPWHPYAPTLMGAWWSGYHAKGLWYLGR
jgi:hypothetical protein